MRVASHDEFLFRVLEAAHLRSSCEENQGGAVISVQGVPVVVAWSSPPAGRPGCDAAGHHYVSGFEVVSDPECVGGKNVTEVFRCDRSMHAEVAAVSAAARLGVKIEGAVVHVSAFPCPDCVKMLMNCRISEIHAAADREGRSFLAAWAT